MKTITKIENDMSSGKSRVAAYCRVSTDMADQLESLEAQKAHYERIIRDNPAGQDDQCTPFILIRKK